jgi:hypothetical protein
MPLVTSSCGATLDPSTPSNSTLPTFGWSSPEIVLRVVVLPAPLAPMSVTISPGSTSMLIPRSAWIAP